MVACSAGAVGGYGALWPHECTSSIPCLIAEFPGCSEAHAAPAVDVLALCGPSDIIVVDSKGCVQLFSTYRWVPCCE